MSRRVSHFLPKAKTAPADAQVLNDLSKITHTEVVAILQASNGEATKSLYDQLLKRGGPGGAIAMNLFRAYKTSTRAKVYRGRAGDGERFRDKAYETKKWSIGELAKILLRHAEALYIRWGWAKDQRMVEIGDPHVWVLYVDLPGIGQVSYHMDVRGVGPDYSHVWDGIRGMAGKRVCELAVRVLDGRFTPSANLIAKDELPGAPAPEPKQADLGFGDAPF